MVLDLRLGLGPGDPQGDIRLVELELGARAEVAHQGWHQADIGNDGRRPVFTLLLGLFGERQHGQRQGKQYGNKDFHRQGLSIKLP
ncbi:hypothetical protein D3C84_959360 [compost metagenome]